jgi:hypothetical protein
VIAAFAASIRTAFRLSSLEVIELGTFTVPMFHNNADVPAPYAAGREMTMYSRHKALVGSVFGIVALGIAAASSGALYATEKPVVGTQFL